jgi:hypothetical protein
MFEAGMAMGKDADRTLVLDFGDLRPFSDFGGRHVVRMSPDDPGVRNAIAERLATARCAVSRVGEDWLNQSFFRDAFRAKPKPIEQAASSPPGYPPPGYLGTDAGDPVNEMEGAKPTRKAITHLGQVLERDVIRSHPSVTVGIDYRPKNPLADVRHYELLASFKNTGLERLDDWELELEFPSALLEPGVVVGGLVRERSNELRSLFRTGHPAMGPIKPGDTKTFSLGYRVDSRDANVSTWFPEVVTVRASINGRIVAETQRPMSRLIDSAATGLR